MSATPEENIVELLTSIFTKCDLDGNGVVDINTLINYLTYQDPTWQRNKTVEDELRKVLCCNGPSQGISKDHFISSLLTNIELKHQIMEENHYDSVSIQEGDAERQYMSGDQFPETSMRNNYMNSEICFVADGHTLTSEEMADEVTEPGCESAHLNMPWVKSLEDEVNALQRKTEYLESTNSSLIAQIASLEEIINKNEKDSAAYSKNVARVKELALAISLCSHTSEVKIALDKILLSSKNLLEIHKQKQEQMEEKLCHVIEENKSVTIQLSQSERETSKLKELIAQLENQIDLISSEKLFLETKLKEIKEKYSVLNELFTKSQEELEDLKMKNKTKKQSFEQLVEQNTNLKLQMESSDLLVQDLKSQLVSTYKELTKIQKEKVKVRLQPANPPDDQSADNSVVFFHETLSLDNTIPYETSLLAELQEHKKELKETQSHCTCMCDWLKDRPLTTSSPVSADKSLLTKSDVAVETDQTSVSHQATMTTVQEIEPVPCTVTQSYRDMGVNCTLKRRLAESISDVNTCTLCLMKSKRSITKRILRFTLLLLCLFLGFLSSLLSVSIPFKRSPMPTLCLSDLFHVSKRHLPPH